MKKNPILRAIYSLVRSTGGNGEIVGILVAVALAVGACVLAMRVLGTGVKAGSAQLGTQVGALNIQ